MRCARKPPKEHKAAPEQRRGDIDAAYLAAFRLGWPDAIRFDVSAGSRAVILVISKLRQLFLREET